MQLNHLKYLQAINQYGSMNKAAKELFVTQPTLTKAIQTLEKDLGSPLIERTSNGVALTDFGKIVLQDSQLILGYVDNWRAIASNVSLSTPIQIQLTGTVPRYELVSNIMYIKKRHPDLDIRVNYTESYKELFSATNPPPRIIVQYNATNDINNAIEYARLHNMKLAILKKDEFVAFLNKENPIANKSHVSLNDLQDSEVIVYHTPYGKFPYIDKLASVNCKIKDQISQEENLMLSLILDPNAIAIRPFHTALHSPYIESGIIQIRHIIDNPMPVNIYILYPAKDRITFSEQHFINALKDYFPEFTPITDK